jgi:hypothetical protein
MVMLQGPAQGRTVTAVQIAKRLGTLLLQSKVKLHDVADIVGRGQNTDPRGIAYMGGGKRPHEVEELRKLTAEIMPEYKRIMFADIHSGVGQEFPSIAHPRPSRDVWLMTSISSTPEHDAEVQRLFGNTGRKQVRVATIAQQDYTDQGDLPEGVEEETGVRGKPAVVSVTVEHATANVPAPGLAERVSEMQGRFYGYRDGVDGERRAKALLRERFVPASKGWRANAIENMKVVNSRMASFLNETESGR